MPSTASIAKTNWKQQNGIYVPNTLNDLYSDVERPVGLFVYGAEQQGGSVDATLRGYYNELYNNLRGRGETGAVDLWDEIDCLQIYSTGDRPTALMEFRNKFGLGVLNPSEITNDVVTEGTTDFVAAGGENPYYTGFKGTAGNKHIRTNFNPSLYPNRAITQNSISVGLYCQNLPTNPTYSYIGGTDLTTHDLWFRIPTSVDVNVDYRINSSSHLVEAGYNNASSGMVSMHRTASNIVYFTHEKTTTGTGTVASTGVIDGVIDLHRLNRGTNYTSGSAGGVSIGTNISIFYAGSSVLYDNLSQFYDSLQAYMSRLGTQIGADFFFESLSFDQDMNSQYLTLIT